VSLHDLGLARVPSTLAIDGSVVSPAAGWPAARVLRGLDYAVVATAGRRRPSGGVRRVLVSLGGGRRAGLSRAIVSELQRRHPRLEFIVTQAGAGGQGAPRSRRVRVVCTSAGLAAWFGRVDVAVVGGGVSLYEAVAAGVPTIALPVVPAQRPTIRGFEQLGLTVGAMESSAMRHRVVARVAARFDALLADATWRQRVRRLGPRVVDGAGARRVARAIASVSTGARRA
jgi:spore coat polysaccharide biosynthesis predicted glycosyltransferase SpsG